MLPVTRPLHVARWSVDIDPVLAGMLLLSTVLQWGVFIVVCWTRSNQHLSSGASCHVPGDSGLRLQWSWHVFVDCVVGDGIQRQRHCITRN